MAWSGLLELTSGMLWNAYVEGGAELFGADVVAAVCAAAAVCPKRRPGPDASGRRETLERREVRGGRCGGCAFSLDCIRG